MAPSPAAAHVTTVHHPLDPRIYRKEVASLRSASIETWLIARDTPDRAPDSNFLGLTDGNGVLNRLRRHAQAFHHLRALRPRIVHIHDPELIPLAYLAKRLYGCRIVYDMHEDYAGRRRFGGRLLRVLEKWSFGWVDHVVLAESSYERILRGRSTPSTALLNYVLPEDAVSSTSGQRPLTLIYTGTISNCRGLNHMLDLAREIKRAGLDWRLKIVGVSHLPNERSAAEKRISAEDLGSVVERVGWDRYVPWSTIVTHYADADFGLALFQPLPNHTESILSKFYEYIYFGLPVIHSQFPLWDAFFSANGCGVGVEPTSPETVLCLIQDILSDDRFVWMRERTVAIRDQYVWRNMEPRLLDLYDRLIENGAEAREISVRL